jgi:(p)ppGpp synthase/HD superfamily hydrolase
MRPIPGTITDPAVDQLLTQPAQASSPTGAELLALAEALAPVAHAGQSRKGTGEPYVNHVRRVAGRVQGWRAKTIALLHDTVEDTRVSENVLALVGFPDEIVYDVLALSRIPGESYTDFIDRTIRTGTVDALRVKLADLQDNLTDPWASQTKLATRYIPAAEKVAAELERRTSA